MSDPGRSVKPREFADHRQFAPHAPFGQTTPLTSLDGYRSDSGLTWTNAIRSCALYA